MRSAECGMQNRESATMDHRGIREAERGATGGGLRSDAARSEAPRPGFASPLLLVISAPSGGGKTTLSQQLLAARPEIVRAVTCTTRDPRPGEREAVDYYFLDAASFLKRVQAGNFLEHATVYGNSYGTLKAE